MEDSNEEIVEEKIMTDEVEITINKYYKKSHYGIGEKWLL